MNAKRWLLGSLFLLFCSQQDARSDDTYTINVAENISNAFERLSIEQFFDAVYEHVDITPEYQYFPSTRGMELVNSGVLDAEASRFPSVIKPYSNLIQVPAAISQVKASLICLSSHNCELRDGIIAVVKGFLRARQFCGRLRLDCYYSDDYATLIRVLERKKANFILAPDYALPNVICKSDISSFYIKPVIELTGNTFHYVHKKHSHLVQQLANAIRNVKKETELDEKMNDWQCQARKCHKDVFVLDEIKPTVQ